MITLAYRPLVGLLACMHFRLYKLQKLEPTLQFDCHIHVQHIKIDKKWLILLQLHAVA